MNKAVANILKRAALVKNDQIKKMTGEPVIFFTKVFAARAY
ncbi:hypothetical protein SD77_2110 [Bacillus badius]|uniref:Uncharacterized protein n=1 Tax=Bacillus badius TaxID=1455 RepID=A0ABR5AY42_BACBA|nr:hypothetical protein SD78_2425 [Bacillus badius]KIL79656.1 hypothetical protein SD77_2110 [Bacillus badius]